MLTEGENTEQSRKEEANLEDTDVDRRIILKITFKE
jgi:hypothetical protein